MHHLRRPSASERLTDLLACRVADQVLADPTLIEQAKEVLPRLEGLSSHVDTWRKLLEAGPAAVAGVLTSTHDGVRHLKTDSPLSLLGLIDEDTRLALVDSVYRTTMRDDPPTGPAGSSTSIDDRDDELAESARQMDLTDLAMHTDDRWTWIIHATSARGTRFAVSNRFQPLGVAILEDDDINPIFEVDGWLEPARALEVAALLVTRHEQVHGT